MGEHSIPRPIIRRSVKGRELGVWLGPPEAEALQHLANATRDARGKAGEELTVDDAIAIEWALRLSGKIEHAQEGGTYEANAMSSRGHARPSQEGPGR